MSFSNAIKNLIMKQQINPVTIASFSKVTIPALNEDQNNRKDLWACDISTCG